MSWHSQEFRGCWDSESGTAQGLPCESEPPQLIPAPAQALLQLWLQQEPHTDPGLPKSFRAELIPSAPAVSEQGARGVTCASCALLIPSDLQTTNHPRDVDQESEPGLFLQTKMQNCSLWAEGPWLGQSCPAASPAVPLSSASHHMHICPSSSNYWEKIV